MSGVRATRACATLPKRERADEATNTLGHTVLYGEYASYFDQLLPLALNSGATGSTFTRWGFGLAQEVDAAAMTLWIKYRQQGVEITGLGLGDIEDFRHVSAGGLINF